jgi:hypothetical protein
MRFAVIDEDGIAAPKGSTLSPTTKMPLPRNTPISKHG